MCHVGRARTTAVLCGVEVNVKGRAVLMGNSSLPCVFCCHSPRSYLVSEVTTEMSLDRMSYWNQKLEKVKTEVEKQILEKQIKEVEQEIEAIK